MPPHRTYYDGNYVVMHSVQRGESLSAIAQKYKFKSWQPIWLYNTQVEPMLDPRGDPGSLAVGQHLFIPRSKEGYDKLLKKLEALKEGLAASGEGQMYELEGLENQYKAETVLFDFAGDVATLLASLGFKAMNVVKLRREAGLLKGAQRFAKEIQLKKGVEDLAEAVSAKELGKSAVDGAVGWQANQMADDDAADRLRLASTFGTKTVPKAAKAISSFRSRRKLGPALQKVVGGSSFLDVADMVMDYVKVSTLANGYLRVVHGETVEGSLNSARDSVRANIGRGLANLHEKILRIQKERDLLYGSTGPAPAETPATRLP